MIKLYKPHGCLVLGCHDGSPLYWVSPVSKQHLIMLRQVSSSQIGVAKETIVHNECCQAGIIITTDPTPVSNNFCTFSGCWNADTKLVLHSIWFSLGCSVVVPRIQHFNCSFLKKLFIELSRHDYKGFEFSVFSSPLLLKSTQCTDPTTFSSLLCFSGSTSCLDPISVIPQDLDTQRRFPPPETKLWTDFIEYSRNWKMILASVTICR